MQIGPQASGLHGAFYHFFVGCGNAGRIESLTLVVVGRLPFPGGGEGGRVTRVFAVHRVAVGVARVALYADVVDLGRTHPSALPLYLARSESHRRTSRTRFRSKSGIAPTARRPLDRRRSRRPVDTGGRRCERSSSTKSAEAAEKCGEATERARSPSDSVIGWRSGPRLIHAP